MEIFKKVDNEIIASLDNATQQGQIALAEKNAFKRTFAVAKTVQELRSLLTPQVMEPIMSLAGSSLGFKTDKEYRLEIIKDCLIQACIHGVYPVGNMFNVIAKQFYITREGFQYKLDNYSGLRYMIIPELPKISNPSQKGSSAVQPILVKWEIKGKKYEQKLEFPMKYYANIGEMEALAGKGKRKAMCWLWNTITGQVLAEADAEEHRVAHKETIDIDILQESTKESKLIDDNESIINRLKKTPITEKEFLDEIAKREGIPSYITLLEIDKDEEFRSVKDFINKNFNVLVTQALNTRNEKLNVA
jgi:hypothetical protein